MALRGHDIIPIEPKGKRGEGGQEVECKMIVRAMPTVLSEREPLRSAVS